MAVRVRLTRVGSKKNPIWRVVVTDQRSPRDGRFIEQIGHYNPQTQPSTIVIDRERLEHWIALGAQPTNTVRKLMRAKPTAAEAAADSRGAEVDSAGAEAGRAGSEADSARAEAGSAGSEVDPDVADAGPAGSDADPAVTEPDPAGADAEGGTGENEAGAESTDADPAGDAEAGEGGEAKRAEAG